MFILRIRTTENLDLVCVSEKVEIPDHLEGVFAPYWLKMNDVYEAIKYAKKYLGEMGVIKLDDAHCTPMYS